MTSKNPISSISITPNTKYITENDVEYKSVILYVKKKYLIAFKAVLNDFYTNYIVFFDDYKIIGCVGIKPFVGNKLLSEQYIDINILQDVNSIASEEIMPSEFAEVGNLTMNDNINIRYILSILIYTLYQFNYKWCVLVTFDYIINACNKLNFKTFEIISAKKKRLSSNSDWGIYYDKSPKLYYGDIFNSFHNLFSDNPDSLKNKYLTKDEYKKFNKR